MKTFRFALLTSVALSAQVTPTAGGNYASLFEAWLTGEAVKHWDRREAELANITTRDQVKARQEYVRRTIREQIGELPAEKGPLNAQVTGRFERPGYRVENIIFESQPGFRVTGNLYLPLQGSAPYPAVLGVAGHSANGKASATYQMAFIGFVKQGFAVFAIDPPGQGERSEYFDAATGKSRVGIGTGEHTMAGLQCLLTGHTMARYEIWDGVRAVDYLLTRADIDPKRIAVAGNSGGGTQAAYLAAVEPRLAAIVSSCYMTRWRELWSGPGPQDAEQVMPSFIARGLDFSDFPLAWAPRPFLMTTAIQDFFPIAGARATYKQTQRLFDLLGGGDRAGYFEFDDTHGWSKPRREAAYSFLGRWLAGRDSPTPEPPIQTEEESLLYATPTGQLATSTGSETVQSINLRRARELAGKRGAVSRQTLEKAIGWNAVPQVPAARVLGNTTVQGISAERLELTVEGGVPIPALLFQAQRQARTRVVVFASSFGKSNDADVAALVKHGTTVLAVDPRGIGESYSAGGRSGYRQAYQLGARAILLGRNLLEMQSSDLVAAVRYMESRPEAAGRKVSLYAKGGLGPAALMAGVLYPAIAELVIERSIVSYMDVAAAAVHEGMDQLIVPGILQSADLPDAMRLLAGRPLTLISPLQPNGKPLLAGDVQSRLGSTMPNVSVILRGEGWPADRAIPRWFE